MSNSRRKRARGGCGAAAVDATGSTPAAGRRAAYFSAISRGMWMTLTSVSLRRRSEVDAETTLEGVCGRFDLHPSKRLERRNRRRLPRALLEVVHGWRPDVVRLDAPFFAAALDAAGEPGP